MPRIRPPGTSTGSGIAVIAILLLAVAGGFYGSGLPRVRPATAADSLASAARAVHDLTVISATPHPTGTVAHDRVRDYLVDRLGALGCSDVHVQSAVGFNTLDGPIAATVANVVCRRRGLHGGPAILLTAHYDAVPRSYGAADDGSGVAALLETLRALDASAPLDRDLIILCSDAEEDGLLGAEAFVDLHPWAKDVGVVLNFDARGDQGPVFMFQTSAGNAPLIAALARSVPDARTNSLTGEVYRHLPSDTDLSIWLHSAIGVGALNFANVGGYTHYHTPIDNLASLDLRTVQQMADYAVGLTRYLGHASLARLATHDDVYANLPLVGVVHYAAAWALPLAAAAMVLVLVWMVRRIRQRQITVRPFAWGSLAVLAILVVPAAATVLLWRIVTEFHPGYADILQGDPYNSRWYLLAVLAMTVAIVAGLLAWNARKGETAAIVAPALLLTSLLGMIVAVTVPGATYLFAWPVIAMALALLWPGTMRLAGRGAIILAIAAAPALLCWPPLISALETGLTARALPLCALLLSVMLLLVLPPLLALREWTRVLAAVAALVTIGAIAGAELTAGWSSAHKHPDSLDYVVDIASHQGRWLSFDRTADPWTAHGAGPRTVTSASGDAPVHRRPIDARVAADTGFHRRGRRARCRGDPAARRARSAPASAPQRQWRDRPHRLSGRPGGDRHDHQRTRAVARHHRPIPRGVSARVERYVAHLLRRATRRHRPPVHGAAAHAGHAAPRNRRRGISGHAATAAGLSHEQAVRGDRHDDHRARDHVVVRRAVRRMLRRPRALCAG